MYIINLKKPQTHTTSIYTLNDVKIYEIGKIFLFRKLVFIKQHL